MKEWSKVTPRLCTVWESLMLVSFSRILEGKGSLFHIFLGEIKIKSVLSSINSNLFFVIQSFKSEIQHCMDWMMSCNCECVPICRAGCHHREAMMRQGVMVHNVWEWLSLDHKRIGPSTEPCGTPNSNTDGEEEIPFTETTWVCSKRQHQNQERAVSDMPKAWWRQESKVSWSMVSKAAERPNKDNNKMWLSSRVVRRLFMNSGLPLTDRCTSDALQSKVMH